jgi:hypothetical protein
MNIPASLRTALATTLALATVMVAAPRWGLAVDARPAGAAAAPETGVKRLARPPLEELRRRTLEGVLGLPAAADPSVAATLEHLWSDASAGNDSDVLERIARSAALVDDRAAELVRLCAGPVDPWLVPDPWWLDDRDTPIWLRNNLRLYFGRWLAQRQMYDRALGVLAGLEPQDVADPASLLFYQGAAYHHQLRKSPGLRALDRLLDDVADCPPRFRSVAGLMREDLKKLKDDSLDHVSRRMDDIRRRLDFGNAGSRTRRIEDGVIESLDKIIEELEKQQQGGGGGGGGSQSGTPMQDSRIAKQKGPGNTDRKDVGRKSDWGDLPPETRDQIRQQLGRELPAHYYDLIQQYFNNPKPGGGK